MHVEMFHESVIARIDSLVVPRPDFVGVVARNDAGLFALVESPDGPDDVTFPRETLTADEGPADALARCLRRLFDAPPRAVLPLPETWGPEGEVTTYFVALAPADATVATAHGPRWCDRLDAAKRLLAVQRPTSRARDLQLLALACAVELTAERRILRAVRELHRRGFEGLRVTSTEAHTLELTAPGSPTLTHPAARTQRPFDWSEAVFDDPAALADRLQRRVQALVHAGWGSDADNVRALEQRLARDDASTAIPVALLDIAQSSGPFRETLQPVNLRAGRAAAQSPFRETLQPVRARVQPAPVPVIAASPVPRADRSSAPPAYASQPPLPPPEPAPALKPLQFAAKIGDLAGTVGATAPDAPLPLAPPPSEVVASLVTGPQFEVPQGFDPFVETPVEIPIEAAPRAHETPAPRDTTPPAPRRARSEAEPVLCRARGALLGLAVGDALGASTTGTLRDCPRRPALVAGPLRDMNISGPGRSAPPQTAVGTWMACAVGHSLLPHRALDADALAARQAAVLSRLDPSRTSQDLALVRGVPLSIYHARDAVALQRASLDDATRTHTGARSRIASAALNAAITRAVVTGCDAAGMIAAAMDAVNGAAQTLARGDAKLVRDALDARRTLTDALRAARRDDPDAPTPRGGLRDGDVGRAFGVAFWTLAHAPSLEAALVDLVNRGGDASVNAAVAGALFGARDGDAAVPSRWLDAVLAAPPPADAEELHPRTLVEFAEFLFEDGVLASSVNNAS